MSKSPELDRTVTALVRLLTVIDSDRMHQFNQHWQDLGGLQGFQQHLGKILDQIS